MSTQGVQQDLTEAFQHVEDQRQARAQELREQALEGGARYRSPPTTNRSEAGEDLNTDKHTCQNCGSTVTPTYHRAQSDNDGVLWHCGTCTTASAMKNGAGALPDYERRCENTGHLGGGL